MPVSSKLIRKRIKSVASTKKITRTMEMVATSKLQKTQGRVLSSRPYMAALTELMEALAKGGETLALYPLFEQRAPIKRVLVLGITANRGLCGGFNSNLVRKIRDHVKSLQADGIEVSLHMAGKKGIAALRFLEIPMDAMRTDLADSPDFAGADSVSAPLLAAFLEREVDRVDVVYADFKSAGEQPPTVITLLPVGGVGEGTPAPADEKPAQPGLADEFIFEPSPKEILEELGPTYVKNMMYRILLSSVASEQIARRMAMKNATDNASEMEKNLTREYNKARQAQITQELAEIVGGVEALK